MTTLTIPEAQRFLAEQLPELIICVPLSASMGVFSFNWKLPNGRQGMPVRDTEWDSIVRLVEGKLTKRQLAAYTHRLHENWPANAGETFIEWLIKLDYVQRATALKQTIGEE